MFGFGKPALPVTPEWQRWVDDGFLRLATLLGVDRILQAPQILPTREYFPDPYDGTAQGLPALFHRVAHAMRLDPAAIDVTLFGGEEDRSQELVPFGRQQSSGAGGLYFHNPDARPAISINASELKDPMALVAILAHELGHVILLRPGLVKREEADMEPLNDLLTVFLGFGIFTANVAFRFEQFTDTDRQGWSNRRLGYLSEETFGYALARFAFERGEVNPAWIRHLTRNVAAYFKQAAAWLREKGERLIQAGADNPLQSKQAP